MPLRCEAFNRPLHDESDISSKVVAEPGDENVASNDEPPLRLCNDGDFGITRVIVVAPTAVGIWAGSRDAAVVVVTGLTVTNAAVVWGPVDVGVAGNDLAIVEALLALF